MPFSPWSSCPIFLPDQRGPVREAVELYEFVLPGRGHRYGFLVEERMEGYEIVAYYRIPSIIGYSRERAIEKALERRSDP